MSSSLYNSMGRQAQNPIGGQFQQFMGQIKGQMQGRNPQDVINQMVSTGQLSQQQLKAAADAPGGELAADLLQKLQQPCNLE